MAIDRSAQVAKAIQSVLTDADRKPRYRGLPNILAGQCYVATEAAYHMLGGSRGGWHPIFIAHEGEPHWFLRHDDGRVLDITASQFRRPVPYDEGVGKGFLTREPSKRAASVMARARRKLNHRGARESEGIDRSTHPTVVEYAVQELFKKRSPAVAAKRTAEKLSGSENLFFGPGVTLIDPQTLEAALWERLRDFTIKGMSSYKPDKRDWALDGTIDHFKQRPSIRPKLKALVEQKLGPDVFTARERAAREAPRSAGLVCMGREVTFDLDDGDSLDLPARMGMLYDGSGSYWPNNSLLCVEFEQGSDEVDAGHDYFGSNAIVYKGHVDLPPKALGEWQRVGVVTQVFYDRAGTKHPGYYKHEFNAPRGMVKLIALFKKRVATGDCVLYELDGCYRLELPKGCIIDDRGIVLP